MEQGDQSRTQFATYIINNAEFEVKRSFNGQKSIRELISETITNKKNELHN